MQHLSFSTKTTGLVRWFWWNKQFLLPIRPQIVKEKTIQTHNCENSMRVPIYRDSSSAFISGLTKKVYFHEQPFKSQSYSYNEDNAFLQWGSNRVRSGICSSFSAVSWHWWNPNGKVSCKYLPPFQEEWQVTCVQLSPGFLDLHTLQVTRTHSVFKRHLIHSLMNSLKTNCLAMELVTRH